MSEALKYEGKLRRLEMEASGTRLRMRGLVSSIRDLLDPTEPVENLSLDIVAGQAVDLAALHADLTGLRARINTIKRVLGR